MIRYQAHLADIGWQPEVENGQVAGTIGEHRAMEAIRITAIDEGLNIHGFAYVRTIGESTGNVLGEDIGSTGLGLQTEYYKIGLIGELAEEYDIWYRCHVEDFGWLQWSKNGQVNGTKGGNKQVEAIQIELHRKSENWYPYVDDTREFIDLTPPVDDTDAKRRAIIERGVAELGTPCKPTSKYGEYYGDAKGESCCYFVRYIYELCGCGELFPKTGYVPTEAEWFKKNSKFLAPGNRPDDADPIMFDYNRNGVPDHTGFVHGSDGYTITTVEANTGSPERVMLKSYYIHDATIYGFGQTFKR